VTALFKVQARWNGWAGAPGYTNLYFETSDPLSGGAQQAVDNVRAFFATIKDFIPGACSVLVSPTVDMVEDTDGELDDTITVATPPLVVTGGSGATFAAVAGACITWKTAGVVAGRRVRGRTFIVPMSANQYQADGSLVDAAIPILVGAASALRTATGPTFVIWHRPTGSPASGGSSFAVTAQSISDKVSYLSSRRD
jgi:hypothetical protein